MKIVIFFSWFQFLTCVWCPRILDLVITTLFDGISYQGRRTAISFPGVDALATTTDSWPRTSAWPRVTCLTCHHFRCVRHVVMQTMTFNHRRGRDVWWSQTLVLAETDLQDITTMDHNAKCKIFWKYLNFENSSFSNILNSGLSTVDVLGILTISSLSQSAIEYVWNKI